MRYTTKLSMSCAIAALATSPTLAQPVAPTPETSAQDSTPSDAADAEIQNQPQAIPSNEIIVTARKRQESLQDVPVAVTAVTGDIIERRGLQNVRDIAALTPGLNINSDAAGRAFVAIRGVGITLVDSVQPGVGIFLDGIYQPNTSYLNNPLIDIERVEVLRGPQGTLYGKNTLGGAINVITRQPGNTLEGTFIGSYAGPDNSWFASGSISGPIIADRLQARLAYGHREQDGFIRNTTLGIDANLLNTDTLNATLRAEPWDDVVLTVNGAYDWVKGGSTPYAVVSGPRDYNRNIERNTTNYQFFEYKRANARLEFPLDTLSTQVTLIGAYDERELRSPFGDLDFSGADIARQAGTDVLRTRTAEARFDSTLSDSLSSIVGLFYSRETRDQDATTTIVPLNLSNRALNSTENDTWAVFGNLFWRPVEEWEVSAGLRYDEQKRDASGAVFLAGAPVPIPDASLNENHLSPRIAVTRHWNRDLMTYASVSRGFRGGGFNAPTAPAALRTYEGDKVWAYELGTKYSSPDRRFSIAAAVFYNDYKDLIGLNSIVPASTGGFTTVDLNTGDVETYGLELEGSFRPVDNWTLSGGVSLQRARLTDTSIYTATTGRLLASDRLPFQPDWNFSLNSDYVVPVGTSDLTFSASLIGKGDRIAGSLSETVAPVLDEYVLVNGQVTYRTGELELSAFVNNLFNKNYFESYIEKTTLILAGLVPTDIGLVGDKRRYGVRARFRF
jgi:iron complex outermembrane recepter protein